MCQKIELLAFWPHPCDRGRYLQNSILWLAKINRSTHFNSRQI